MKTRGVSGRWPSCRAILSSTTRQRRRFLTNNSCGATSVSTPALHARTVALRRVLIIATCRSEHGDNRTKASALKKVIQLVLSGERFPGLLMVIIRFVLPCNDHAVKKLLLLVWEVWPKTSSDGKLLHEMILVCDAYRRASRNHYIFTLFVIHNTCTCM